MPVAWCTFWKSTWGTRVTPADIAEMEKRKAKAAEKEQKKKMRNASQANKGASA